MAYIQKGCDSTPANGWGELPPCKAEQVDLTVTVQHLMEQIKEGNVFFQGERVLSLVHLSRLYYNSLEKEGE